ENGLDEAIFEQRFTVGFLWRHRVHGYHVSSLGQTPAEVVLRTKSELLSRLITDFGAHVLICGMNVRTTDQNRERVGAKFTERRLNLDAGHCTYLKGLSWGLELKIIQRCSLCIVMASGFSEALWMQRPEATVLVDTPPDYVAKLLWNRMPFFNVF